MFRRELAELDPDEIDRRIVEGVYPDGSQRQKVAKQIRDKQRRDELLDVKRRATKAAWTSAIAAIVSILVTLFNILF